MDNIHGYIRVGSGPQPVSGEPISPDTNFQVEGPDTGENLASIVYTVLSGNFFRKWVWGTETNIRALRI
jgi:hypothetical protein